MSHSHIHIKLTYGNGESDSLCGKIRDMHTFGKYANNAAITYMDKTDKPKCGYWLVTSIFNFKGSQIISTVIVGSQLSPVCRQSAHELVVSPTVNCY